MVVGGAIGAAAGAYGGARGNLGGAPDVVRGYGVIPPAQPGQYGYQSRFQAGANAAGERGLHPNLLSSVYGAISQAEGTMRGGQINYDDMLGHPGGVLGTPPKPISQMTVTELLDWQTQMLRNPNNKWNSSAAGAFQIVRSNILAAVQEGRIKPTDTFNQATQERLAGHLWRHGGSRHWEGFKANEGLRAQAERLARGTTGAPGGNRGYPFPTVGENPMFPSLPPAQGYNPDGGPGWVPPDQRTRLDTSNIPPPRGGTPAWANNPNVATYTPQVNVQKPNGINVEIKNATGGNAVTSAASVAQ